MKEIPAMNGIEKWYLSQIQAQRVDFNGRPLGSISTALGPWPN
jgi:hypothetical protein